MEKPKLLGQSVRLDAVVPAICWPRERPCRLCRADLMLTCSSLCVKEVGLPPLVCYTEAALVCGGVGVKDYGETMLFLRYALFLEFLNLFIVWMFDFSMLRLVRLGFIAGSGAAHFILCIHCKNGFPFHDAIVE